MADVVRVEVAACIRGRFSFSMILMQSLGYVLSSGKRRKISRKRRGVHELIVRVLVPVAGVIETLARRDWNENDWDESRIFAQFLGRQPHQLPGSFRSSSTKARSWHSALPRSARKGPTPAGHVDATVEAAITEREGCVPFLDK